MRLSRELKQDSSVRSSFGVAAAAVASSGIVLNISEANYFHVQSVEMLISNCEDPTGNTSANLRLRLKQVVDPAHAQVVALEVMALMAGVWKKQGEDYTQKLTNFMSVKAAGRLFQLVSRHLAERWPRAPCEDECFEVTHAYPMRELLRVPLSPCKRFCQKILGQNFQGYKWIAHLRAAGLTEREIASHGAELIHLTSKLYNPDAEITMTHAIKEAFKCLQQPQLRDHVIKSYIKKQWPLFAAQGVNEPVEYGADYARLSQLMAFIQEEERIFMEDVIWLDATEESINAKDESSSTSEDAIATPSNESRQSINSGVEEMWNLLNVMQTAPSLPTL